MIYIKLTRALILNHSKIHQDFLVKITIPCEDPSLMLGSAIKSE